MKSAKSFKAVVIVVALSFVCCIGLYGCNSDALKTTADKKTETQTTQQTEQASEKSAQEAQESTSSEQAQTASSSEATPGASQQTSDSSAVNTITISVVVDASAADRGYFASATVSLPQGATPYDALCATGLPFGGDAEYVSAINGLAEFDCGGSSGWRYSVNGQTPSAACGSYALNNGDSVNWYYVV